MRAPLRWLGDRFAMIAAFFVLFYLFLPVLYTFVFSFNDYRKSNITWNSQAGPTLKHWANPCGAPGICDSLAVSLQVAVIATLTSTVLGTMIAFALVRHRFRGRSAGNMLVFVPMATPEIVLGASLLTIFVQGFSRLGLQLGFTTIVIAHIMFCLSFVVVTVKARLILLGVAKTGRAHRCAIAAGQATRGHLVPAGMFQPTHQSIAQRVSRQAASLSGGGLALVPRLHDLLRRGR